MGTSRTPRPATPRVAVSPLALRRRLDRLAAAQRGLVTARQLQELGASRKVVRSLLAGGELVHQAHRRGVYRCAGAGVDWVTVVLAAVLAAGPDAVASHWTAARVWDLVDADRPSTLPAIHVTSPRQVRLPGVVAHRATLGGREATRRHDVPVTTACRTLCDIAGDPSFGLEAFGALIDEALRRRIVRLAELRAVAWKREARGRPGTLQLRAALADRGADLQPAANNWEAAMDRWWDAAGLPPARRQYRVRTPRRSYVVDRAIVELRIAVEWNGFDRHGDRTGMDRTSAKELDLASVGWITLPVTSNTPAVAIWRAVEGAIRQRRRTRPVD